MALALNNTKIDMLSDKETMHHISSIKYDPVGWGCRILRLHIYRRVRLPDEWPKYDTKQSVSEALVTLEIWGMRSTPSLPSLPGSLWPGVVSPGMVLAMKQTVITLNRIIWKYLFLTLKMCTNVKLNCWNRTVLTFKLCTDVKLNCLK